MAQAAGKTVTLEDIPGNAVELEEYVAALFQASKHFVEMQDAEREPKAEILELDAVATSYETGSPESVLVEGPTVLGSSSNPTPYRGHSQFEEDLGLFFGSFKEIVNVPKSDADFNLVMLTIR